MDAYRSNWETTWFALAILMARRSFDPSTQVGCVLTTQDNRILQTGYNGFPRNIDPPTSLDDQRLARPEKYNWFAHAEENAVANAANQGVSLAGSILYIYPVLPCSTCTRIIINAGVSEVRYSAKMLALFLELVGKDKSRLWVDGFNSAESMFQSSGVKVTDIDPFVNAVSLNFQTRMAEQVVRP